MPARLYWYMCVHTCTYISLSIIHIMVQIMHLKTMPVLILPHALYKGTRHKVPFAILVVLENGIF